MLTVPEAEPPAAPAPQLELRTVAPQPKPKPPKGTVLAHGGGPMRKSTFDQFAELCGDGTMVLIPTAAYAAEHRSYRKRVRKSWLEQGIHEVVVLHARDRGEADDHLAEPLRRASCAWLSGGVQGRLEDRYVGTPVERELHALLQRGGTVGGDSAGSSIMSRVMIHHGNPDPVEGTGLGILPEVIVDQHFLVREREPRLVTMVERHPDLVGVGIDESTALLIQGDRFRVIGDSVVRRCTAEDGCADLPPGTEGRLSEPPPE
ncbi:cyanophycinase [Paraliomyxa miuraensis]|uniref:cyanophycinase n=1 Tax=Paraliomyxa miuraensis TaxID=376150 RepID=UPI002252EB26|nr:cyanophycinase [Paraliomyxa miuraensis]MCX4240498.1 cyanophycinase [Paraliomyxa miuraensis]